MTRSRNRPLDLSISASPAADSQHWPASADWRHSGSLGASPPDDAEDAADPEADGAGENLGYAENAYTIALASGLVWAGALTAYTLFDHSGSTHAAGPLGLLVFCGVVAMPIAFMLLAAYAIRQGARLGLETRHARLMSGQLVRPAALAAVGAADALQTVRDEIGRAGEAAEEAARTLARLRETLAGETQQLKQACAEADRAAGRLTTAFSRERDQMSQAATALGSATQAVTEAVTRQSQIVVDASDLARARAREAQAEISAQVAELSGALGTGADAALAATETLSGQTDRLERAGAFLGERYRGLEAVLNDRHQALQALGGALLDEQKQAVSLLADQRAQLQAAAAEARATAESMVASAQAGSAALRDDDARAAEQARQRLDATRAQLEALDSQAQEVAGVLEARAAQACEAIESETRAAVMRVGGVAAQARATAAQSVIQAEREAAERVEATRAEMDRLHEAGRAAGEAASASAEAVAAQVRRMMDQAAAALSQTGALSSANLEAAKRSVAELNALLERLEARVTALPQAAQAQAEAVRSALAQTADPAARSPAPAAPARAAFAPDRPPERDQTPRSGPVHAGSARPGGNAFPDRADGRPAGANGSAYANSAGGAAPPGRPQPAGPEPRRPEAAAPASADTLGLRPRLRLTPAGPPETGSPTDEADREADDLNAPILFGRSLRSDTDWRTAPAAPPSVPDDWTWKDLLASEEEPQADADELAEALGAEIQAMGVDTSALLPVSRIEEIAAALHAGDTPGARDLVSLAAPAAIRRLSRRVLTDKVLRAQADSYVRRYDGLVSDSAKRDREGHMVSALLGSESGRTYLLLEAAFRELH